MRRPPISTRDNSPIAMTSMIDVVFLLLIFFAVTGGSGIKEMLLPAEIATTGAVESAAPQASDAPVPVDVWLKLSIGPDQQKLVVDMNGTQYSDLDELKGQLRALAELGPENPIVFEIASDVALGDLVDIYDTCLASGFESINFAAKK
ncbi:ExbD/TolR family protein [Planctomicrobium sp. SH668]|uniref:ExbD/TolR family protein n=1 Tax=Planctomicrobium sp. SH668 TaxID=3448126 RepID=UPI003F5C5146